MKGEDIHAVQVWAAWQELALISDISDISDTSDNLADVPLLSLRKPERLWTLFLRMVTRMR